MSTNISALHTRYANNKESKYQNSNNTNFFTHFHLTHFKLLRNVGHQQFATFYSALNIIDLPKLFKKDRMLVSRIVMYVYFINILKIKSGL